MAKGQQAKNNVINKITSLYGSNFVGESNGKIYVWEDDGGQKVQIAISFTTPKNPLEVSSEVKTPDWDWGDPTPAPIVEEPKKNMEVSQSELDDLAKLMERLGL